MTDGDWVETKDQDPTGEVRLIQLADIGDGEFLDKSARYLTLASAERLNCTFLAPGDVLIARMPHPIGRACIFPGTDGPAVAAVDICIWRGDEKFACSRWLMHAINSPEPRSAFEGLAGGTTRQRISGGNLKRHVIPVPPKAEQRRLTNYVDATLARSEEARTDLGRALALAKRYRSSLLAAMLKEAGGDLVPISAVAEVVTGTTPSKKDPGNYGSELNFVKPSDLDAGYFVQSSREKLSKRGAKLARLLPPGSTLVGCIGTIGKTGFARVACATNQQINGLIPDRDTVDPRWLFWQAISPGFQEQMLANASATTLSIINKSRFERLRVTVPSLAIQRRTIERLEKHFEACALAESDATRGLALLSRMNEAALKSLFEGNLGSHARR